VFWFLGHFARSTQAEKSVLHGRVGMVGFEFVEKFLCGPNPPFFRILQVLTDDLLCFDAGGNVEQAPKWREARRLRLCLP
jgi:hypothetical protein